MKKLTRFLTALLLTFALFAHAEMVDTYAFKNQADRTRVLKSIKWWMKEKRTNKLSIR